MMRALALLGLVGPTRAQYLAPGRPGAFGCIPCLDAYFVAPGPESMPGAYAPNRPDPVHELGHPSADGPRALRRRPPTMDAIRVACPVSVAGCEAEDGCLEIVEEALYHSIPRDGSDALMALVSCIKGDGDIGASVHTGGLRESGKCPPKCYAPTDPTVSRLYHRITEDSPTADVYIPGDTSTTGGSSWAILELRAGVTYDILMPDRWPARAGQSRIREECCGTTSSSCSCATRIRFVLIGPDGDQMAAVSTGFGAARSYPAPDGLPSTRNAPILGFKAPVDGNYYLALYDYHEEGGGRVPIELVVNTRPPVTCHDRPDSNCVESYADIGCTDQPTWMSDAHMRSWVDCHYWTSNAW